MHIFIITHLIALIVQAVCLFGGFMQSEFASARHAGVYIFLGFLVATLVSFIFGAFVKGLRSGMWSVLLLSALTVSIADNMARGLSFHVPVLHIFVGMVALAIYAGIVGYSLRDLNRFYMRWNVLIGFIYVASIALMIIIGHLSWHIRWLDLGWKLGAFGLIPGVIAYGILLARIHRYPYETIEPTGITRTPTYDQETDVGYISSRGR